MRHQIEIRLFLVPYQIQVQVFTICCKTLSCRKKRLSQFLNIVMYVSNSVSLLASVIRPREEWLQAHLGQPFVLNFLLQHMKVLIIQGTSCPW